MISIKNLWKAFGGHSVLQGLDLEVKEGETLAIIGRSGCGKSVLLKHILGLLSPDQGAVYVNDICMDSLSESEHYQMLKSMGMLFQGSALFDSLSIAENVGFYLNEHGDPLTGKKLSAEELSWKVHEALERVDLENCENKLPSDLSGGMRKRAALARLLIYRPKIILYDEPTSGLDPITSMHINSLITKLQKELKVTSIVVTHDLYSATEVADVMALHEGGKIAYIDRVEHFVHSKHPTVREFFQNVLRS